MSAGKYNVLLFAEHVLYSSTLEPKHGMHDCMCMMNKGTFTCLSYNTNNKQGTAWDQYGGTGITLNVDMRSRTSIDGNSGDPTKLGIWTLTRIGNKDGIATVFVSAYRSCHNPDGLHRVWSQQARYFKEN